MASLECYIYLTEIKNKGLIRQGGIYSLSSDRCQMGPRLGFTCRVWRRLEFPSHIRCSPVRFRVCQEFKALEAIFLRTEGKRVRGGPRWDGAKSTHMLESLSAQRHRLLFPFFLMFFFPDRNPNIKWRCTGMQEFPPNRNSLRLKSQTMLSSSQVRHICDCS